MIVVPAGAVHAAYLHTVEVTVAALRSACNLANVTLLNFTSNAVPEASFTCNTDEVSGAVRSGAARIAGYYAPNILKISPVVKFRIVSVVPLSCRRRIHGIYSFVSPSRIVYECSVAGSAGNERITHTQTRRSGKIALAVAVFSYSTVASH